MLMEASKTIGFMKAKSIVAEEFEGGLDNLMDLITKESEKIENPSSHVDTTYKRQKFLHTVVPYVEPREIVIGLF